MTNGLYKSVPVAWQQSNAVSDMNYMIHRSKGEIHSVILVE